ncbi:MAG: hypothetical protein JO303_05115 [Caulobacteraceae bacterium]|nr:hypothetical protein [Caulobacteraceae bacterium]
MTAEGGLIGFTAAAALAHTGLASTRAPWPFQTAARLFALGALLGLAVLDAAPAALIAGLSASAAAEAAKAREWRWRAPAILGAILLANLAYAWLFGRYGAGRAALEAEPWRAPGVFGAPALAAMLLTGLWPAVRRWAPACVSITAAGAVSASAAFTLPLAFWTAMPGALLAAMASIGACALALSERRRPGLEAAAWTAGFAGQALIAYAILH